MRPRMQGARIDGWNSQSLCPIHIVISLAILGKALEVYSLVIMQGIAIPSMVFVGRFLYSVGKWRHFVVESLASQSVMVLEMNIEILAKPMNDVWMFHQ
mmetsp:Transcript_26862/g.44257  ORF Transcript_26862/g.44257 Transcript_26862/m.44257 type:complete len:99 (-) Transcript_26862:967-1263(-)